MSKFMVGDFVDILPSSRFDSHYGISVAFWDNYRKQNPFKIVSINHGTNSYRLADAGFCWPGWGLELHEENNPCVPVDDLI